MRMKASSAEGHVQSISDIEEGAGIFWCLHLGCCNRAQGALHQLTDEEVMEVEAKLSPGATEEERTAAYKRARNRCSQNPSFIVVSQSQEDITVSVY